MSIKTCKQHTKEPVFIYAACAGCEIQRYRDKEKALNAENESLRADADRYRHLRECNSSSLCVMQFNHRVLLESDADEAIDAAICRGEQS